MSYYDWTKKRHRTHGGRPTYLRQMQDMVDLNPDGDDCWEFMGVLDEDGYGRVKIDKKQVPAHRVAFDYAYRNLDPDLVIDHLCRNRACYRPSHLRQVTTKENLRAEGSIAPAAKWGDRTHCSAGHPFDEGNTYNKVVNRGKSNEKIVRYCRECRYQDGKRRREVAREARQARHGGVAGSILPRRNRGA